MSDRPNLIWIFGDQHRAQALGCNGDPNVHTPNIDRLASDGVTFDGAVGGCPLCCPYRGSLLSSRYPHNAVPGHEYALDPELPTVATAFKDAGYHTAWIGKWHVDGFHERNGRAALHTITPDRRGGFDKWIGYENNNAQWDCFVHGHASPGDEIEHYRLPGYETDELTQLFIDHLRERASAARDSEKQGGGDKPFFAALSVQPPHNPYVAPEPFMQRHTPGKVQLRPNVPAIPRVVERAQRELAGYYAMIESLDWNVGRIRAVLDELNLSRNTHIIFFSDHGDMHGCHGQFLKTNPYEESLRVPMIVSGSTNVYDAKRGRVNVPMNHVDLAPTSLALCGLDTPDWMAGTDYSGFRLKGRDAPAEPDSAFCQLVVPTGHGHSTDRPWRGVVTRDGWKYITLEHQPWLLFDLNEDPYEQANHAHNTVYRAERKRLQDRLAEWISDTGDSFPLPEDI